MLIDSHCHLNMLDLSLYANDMQNVIDAAKANDVQHLICVAVDLEHFPELCAIQKKFSEVSITMGVHPSEKEGQDPSVEQLVDLAQKHNVVAIGETGLDYYWNKGDLSWQQQRFRRHIQAAKALKLPLIVHTRDAREDTISILKEKDATEVGGVLHCFTESWEMAKQALDLNFYISFSGIVTFKNATKLKEVAKRVPLDRLLVETDSPYLAPVPCRGKPNQPAYVRHVAEYIAELRGESFDVIAASTTNNCKKLFNLS